MSFRNGFKILKLAAVGFSNDDAVTLGAALAFYAALSMAPLLLILLAVTSLLGSDTQKQVIQQVQNVSGEQAGSVIGQIVNGVGMLIIYMLLFALIYKVLPDVQLAWKDVWWGAIITGLLFEIGRYLIGLYLGHSGVGSPYGAAGSLVALLVWIYYASLIFFFGAELTQAYAGFHGRRWRPDEYAELTPAAQEKQERQLQEAHR